MSADILLDCIADQPATMPGAFRAVRGRMETIRPVTADDLIGAALSLLTDRIEVQAHADPEAAPPPPTGPDAADSDLVAWLKLHFASATQEEMLVGYLDRSGRLLTLERIGLGTHRVVPLCIRTLLRRVLALEAGGVVFVHNHLTGNPTPSADDLKTSAYIDRLLSDIGVDLVCEYIVAGAEVRILHRDDWTSSKPVEPTALVIEAQHADIER